RRNVERPKIVGVLLALDDRDFAALFHRFADFGPAIQRLVIDAFEAVDPAAIAVGLTAIEARLGARWSTHFLKEQGTVGVVIVVGDLAVTLLAATFPRAAPVAVSAIPTDLVTGFDQHAEAFEPFLDALVRALGTRYRMLTRFIVVELDAVRFE